jgi:hypothetical protein
MTARGKDTRVEVQGLRGPHVEMVARSDGLINVTFTAFRVKANGKYEHYEMVLEPITVDQAACIGTSARKAISYAWGTFERRARRARERMTTVGSDNA